MSSLKERVKSLQADTSNTDTALNTLEESLSEKVSLRAATADVPPRCRRRPRDGAPLRCPCRNASSSA